MGRTNFVCPRKIRLFRFWVHYWKFNAVTERHSYPIRRMNELINALWKALVFSIFGANRGSWEVEKENADFHKTAFTSQQRL